MSANNISQKQILSYIVSTFQYWGIEGISEEVLKQAKKNNPSSTKEMKRLLLNLSILHMFSYQIKVNNYLPNKIKESEMDEMIMGYLSESECPLLLQMGNERKDQQGNVMMQYFMGCNLQSSRMLLLLCGWVMGISDYFNQIMPNVIMSKLKQIQNPQFSQLSSKSIENMMQSRINNISQVSAVPESITTLYKSIQSRLYSSECYQKKLMKLRQKVTNKLQKISGTNIPIQSLFANPSSIKQQKLQQELYSIISNQMENMGQRKYFWIWLQEKIIKQTENDIKNQHSNYTQQLQQQSLIIYNTQIDLQYLSKYIELCQYYQDKYKELNSRLNAMKLTVKKTKQIQSQVQHQFKQILKNPNKAQHNKKHLFIALQLKNHLNIHAPQSKKQTNQKKQQQNQTQIKTLQLTKKLKKQFKNYLKSIQDAINFI